MDDCLLTPQPRPGVSPLGAGNSNAVFSTYAPVGLPCVNLLFNGKELLEVNLLGSCQGDAGVMLGL